MGRWLSRDPMGERGGLNLYGFSNNSPLNFIDVLGLSWIKINCESLGKEISGAVAQGFGYKVGLGGKLSRCDCCNTDTGEVIDRGYQDITINFDLSIIFGFARELKLPVWKRVGVDIHPVALTKMSSISFTKECGERSTETRIKIAEFSFNRGLHLSGGAIIAGASLESIAKNSGSLDVVIKPPCFHFELVYGRSNWEGLQEFSVLGISGRPKRIPIIDDIFPRQDNNNQKTIPFGETCFK